MRKAASNKKSGEQKRHPEPKHYTLQNVCVRTMHALLIQCGRLLNHTKTPTND
jgi:hypothetical protein